jgi:lipoprotein-releasing system permease protein
MYKLLLCWRYLKTRYLAFACIISVMLGVATLIVVNSVMNGFSTKLRTLLHNVLSDVTIESHASEGFHDPVGKIARIRKDPYLNDRIESMTVTLEAFAMLQYRNLAGEVATRPVRITGIELKSRGDVGGFEENLGSYRETVKWNADHPDQEPKPIPTPSFDIPKELKQAYEEAERQLELQNKLRRETPPMPENAAPVGIPDDVLKILNDGKKDHPPAPAVPPPMPPPVHARVPKGAILGHLIAHFKRRMTKEELEQLDPNDRKPGDDIVEQCVIRKGHSVVLTTVSGGEKLTPVYDSFIVVDYFQSQMSEYDSNCVFIPLEHLQGLRGLDDRATSILVKLKSYEDAPGVKKALGELFVHEAVSVNTWEDKQGPLLRAIEIEKSILNILLFMIIAVAGFGILAIFSMIVSEKTRDIGVLKALGASSSGVMQIFLSYGLLLGVVGALLGSVLGLSITWNINEVEGFIASLTGSRVFDPTVYYFNGIPTDVNPTAVLIVNLGAVAIATVFSILPALRAAMLHPVQALRYE